MRDATEFAMISLRWDREYRPVLGEALNGEFFLWFDCLRDEHFSPEERRECVHKCIKIARLLRLLRYLPDARGPVDRRGKARRLEGYRPSLTRTTFSLADLT